MYVPLHAHIHIHLSIAYIYTYYTHMRYACVYIEVCVYIHTCIHLQSMHACRTNLPIHLSISLFYAFAHTSWPISPTRANTCIQSKPQTSEFRSSRPLRRLQAPAKKCRGAEEVPPGCNRVLTDPGERILVLMRDSKSLEFKRLPRPQGSS